MYRRSILTYGITGILCLFYSLVQPPPLPGQTDSDPFEIKVDRIAPDIYLAHRPDAARLFVEGNVTFIINEHDVVVVDGSGAPAIARRVIGEIRKRTDLKVRYLINTHGHGDHTFGNQAYVEAFPDVEIIAHPDTRAYMVSDRILYFKDIVENIEQRKQQGEAEIRRIRQQAAPGHEAVILHLEQYYRHDLDLRAEAYREIEVTLPTLLVTDRLVLHRGERSIEVIYPGHGKTASDLIVYLPQEKILITGDILTGPVPYGFSRQPGAWLNTLHTLADYEFEVLIPGHGKVQKDRTYLNNVIRLVESALEYVQVGSQNGQDQEDIQKQMHLAGQVLFTKSDPVLEYLYKQWFSDPIVERIMDALAAGS